MQQISAVPEWNTCLNLLADPLVSEIVANGHDQFFVTRKGQRMKLDQASFSDPKAYLQGMEAGLLPHIKSDIPYDSHGYLYEGPLEYSYNGELVKGRCTIVLSPAAYSPQITIAKKSTSLIDIEAIASKGSMSLEMLAFLKVCVKANMTMVFSGGTGAGKTTMLEALTKLIPDSDRIGVAEDTPELVLKQPNVTYLHSVPHRPGMNPIDVASLSWVVQQFQRMRISKVIVGETRGKEFADFLTAANSGMPGSFTTIHADDPKGCLQKMTNFALKGSERQPLRSINTDIASAVDIIVQLSRLPDGRHKIAAIQEITKTLGKDESAQITTQALYKYEASTDSFIKDAQMTDPMRKKFITAGIDLSPFFASTPGTRQPAAAGSASEHTETTPLPPRRGLPTNQNGRRSL